MLKLEGILWILRAGAPWRDLPDRFGKWKGVYTAFRSWMANGFFEAVLLALKSDLRDDEMIMVDSSACRVHQHGANPPGGQLANAIARSGGGLSTKIHMACDALGYPLGFILTGANVSDYDQCKPLLESCLKKGSLALMDKGYDSDSIRSSVHALGGVCVIAPRSNRIVKPEFDEHTYKERHKVENLFEKLKRFRRIATRYEKLVTTFSAMLTLACSMVWMKM